METTHYQTVKATHLKILTKKSYINSKQLRYTYIDFQQYRQRPLLFLKIAPNINIQG